MTNYLSIIIELIRQPQVILDRGSVKRPESWKTRRPKRKRVKAIRKKPEFFLSENSGFFCHLRAMSYMLNLVSRLIVSS
jgi:hypothetical protein